jgi:hypothetical protein
MRLLSVAWSAVHSVQHEEVLETKTMGGGTTDQVTDVPIAAAVVSVPRPERADMNQAGRIHYRKPGVGAPPLDTEGGPN